MPGPPDNYLHAKSWIKKAFVFVLYNLMSCKEYSMICYICRSKGSGFNVQGFKVAKQVRSNED
jgi:hypothetical protein